MRLVFDLDQGLPRLAWCALVTREGTIRVVHGEWVETRPDFMTDGTWEGSFADGDLTTAQMLMGFGVVVRHGKATFCTPCHTLERLHLIDDGARLVVSPSMAFALAAAGCRLDPSHGTYHSDLMRCIEQPKSHVGTLPLAGGRVMTVIHHRNVEVDERLSLRIHPKPEPPDFSSFADYRAYLAGGMKSLCANAVDASRRIRYSPVTTLSSGYDSTACSVLAVGAGCRQAVTFRTARKELTSAGEPVDSGATVGRKLGFQVTEFDRCAYQQAAGHPEAEFVACGDLGQDLPWSVFGEALEQRLVVSGTHGDVVWDRAFKPPGKGIIRKEMSGCSMVEFRSRVGFLYVVPAFFGGWSHPSIHAISNSDEMRAWCVGGSYDRPIPRRIAEEEGIERGSFAQRKKAAAVLLNRDRRLDAFMKAESRAHFERFYRNHRRLRPLRRRVLEFVLFRLRVWYGTVLVYSHLSRIVRIPGFLRFRLPPGRPSFLVHWAMPLIQERYASACRGTGGTSGADSTSPPTVEPQPDIR